MHYTVTPPVKQIQECIEQLDVLLVDKVHVHEICFACVPLYKLFTCSAYCDVQGELDLCTDYLPIACAVHSKPMACLFVGDSDEHR